LIPLPTVAGAGNELWTPAGRHDVGDEEPTALVARIGDVAVGICMVDPRVGPRFAGGPLPAKTDPGGVLVPSALPVECVDRWLRQPVGAFLGRRRGRGAHLAVRSSRRKRAQPP